MASNKLKNVTPKSTPKPSILSDKEKLLIKQQSKVKPTILKSKKTTNETTKKVILKTTETTPTTSVKPKTDTTQVEVKKTSQKSKESKVENKPTILKKPIVQTETLKTDIIQKKKEIEVLPKEIDILDE
jgi:hypothetical protein